MRRYLQLKSAMAEQRLDTNEENEDETEWIEPAPEQEFDLHFHTLNKDNDFIEPHQSRPMTDSLRGDVQEAHDQS